MRFFLTHRLSVKLRFCNLKLCNHQYAICRLQKMQKLSSLLRLCCACLPNISV